MIRNTARAAASIFGLMGSFTGVASAQAPVEFVVDSAATQFTYSGTTSLGSIVGSPPNFSFVGTTNGTMTGTPGAPPQTIALGGGSVMVTPDINASIPNPFPFLPPLAQIQISNLSLRLTSASAPIDASGNFSAQVQASALSGMLTVTPLTGAPTMSDLTGTQSLPQPFLGNLAVLGDTSTLSGPLAINFTFTDASSGLSADINLVGTFVAEAMAAQPIQYCQAAVNSSGGAAAMGHTGSPSLTAADLTLVANGVPANQFLLFLLSDTDGFVPGFSGSQGNLCLGGSIVRLNNFLQNSGPSGQATLPLPFGSFPAGTDIGIGETRYFQAWFRDTAGGVATSNTTAGLQVTFAP